jgi:hypothetical protein
MKALWIGRLVDLLLVVAWTVCPRWKEREALRPTIQTLGQLDTALHTGNSANFLNLVCIPAAIQGRTSAEQTESSPRPRPAKSLLGELNASSISVLPLFS